MWRRAWRIACVTAAAAASPARRHASSRNSGVGDKAAALEPPPPTTAPPRRPRPQRATTTNTRRVRGGGDGDGDGALPSGAATLLVAPPPPHPVILDGLDAVAAVPSSSAATWSVHAQHDVAQQHATSRVVTARRLWAATRVARASRHVRVADGVCVVGGADAVRRIWRTYAVRPLVVFVPDADDDGDTAGAVPSWCAEAALPTYVVRAPASEVRRQLLSAEYSDGCAAAFPLAPLAARWPSLSSLCDGGPRAGDGDEGGKDAAAACASVSAMLVLVGLRVPSNVGVLLRAAVDMGYDSVVLVDCVDVTHEKVLRASGGAVFAPSLRVFTHHTATVDGDENDDDDDGGAKAGGGDDDDDGSCAALLSRIARRHGLLPLLAVPSQDVSPAFATARRLFAATPPPRPMLVLGGEAAGLRTLSRGRWTAPYELVTLPMPNGDFVDSYNVAVAGATLLHTFRPAAAAHMAALLRAHDVRTQLTS